MKCSYCGHENPEKEVYCSECGMKLRIPEGEPKGILCKTCGVMNPENASLCRNCSQPLKREAFITCPQCRFNNLSDSRFCAHCGAKIASVTQKIPVVIQPVAKLVLQTLKEVVISEADRTLGREDFLQHILPGEAKYISREHFRIFFEDGKYYILDEKSTNGTTLNGAEIKGQGRKELKNNDEVVLAGAVRLRFHVGCQTLSEGSE